MSRTAKDRAAHIATLAREGISDGDIALLLRHASTCDRINEADCSEEMSARREKQIRAQEATAERRIREICAQYPQIVKVEFQGDPRGFPVRLFFKSERSNTWGGKESGYGI